MTRHIELRSTGKTSISVLINITILLDPDQEENAHFYKISYRNHLMTNNYEPIITKSEDHILEVQRVQRHSKRDLGLLVIIHLCSPSEKI